MDHLHKINSINLLYRVFLIVLFCSQTWKTTAAEPYYCDFRKVLTNEKFTNIADTSRPLTRDSIRLMTDEAVTDTLKLPLDSVTVMRDTFSLKLSKDSLDAPVKYEAEDSAVVLIQQKKILLYGKTKTEYTDIVLTAPKVEIDQATQIVTAVNSKDSTGAVIENAHFKSGTNEFTSDTIQFNFKTQIGLTTNTITQDGEMFVHGEKAKKVSADVTFVKNARFTTCNLDEPHFAFLTPKMKVINQKLAVSGPAHPEFEGVPVPIWLPFGFYPLSKGRHSGLIAPQFTTNDRYGLGLEGLGYYKVISDYWDAKLYGDIYSYGGWSANLNPTYRKRYRYSGAFNLSVRSTKLNFKGDPDYFANKSYFLTWTHSVDSRARPGTSFSASVNAGSTKFNQLVPNNNNVNFQNQLGSSISYSKTWIGKPYNLTLSANHNQNNMTGLINVSLPDAGFTVSTIYPFQKEDAVGTPKWYEKLGVGYNGNFRNQVSFYDSAFRFKSLIDTLQWGAVHRFPIITSLPPILNGAVIVSPGISYSQVWIAQKFRRSWNTAEQKVDTSITKGFFTDHQMSFTLSFNTAVYGTYQFKKSRIAAIRHVIRPTISMNYNPDLSKSHWYSDTVNTSGYVRPMSEFEGALYPGFSQGKTGSISFQFDNNLEMKWRSRKDTGENAIKKITLIDGFGFRSAYNFLGDSLKLSNIDFYLRTTLFEKISITATTSMNPYQMNEFGDRIDKYAWEGEKFKLGTLMNGSIAISTNFQSKPKDEKKDEQRKMEMEEVMNDPTLVADRQSLLDYMQQNPGDFVDFNIPWQLNLGYSLAFYSRLRPDYSGYDKEFTSNLTFNGSFNLTPKWKFTANGYFDITSKQLQSFSMSINRDMHCWQLSINVTPVGPFFRSFSFSISPKASMLQDLKVNRNRYFTNF